MKIIFKSILIISMLFANSGGPGQGYAHNAPNYNNCTSCHSGSVNSGDGEVVFTGLPNSYIPGETYSIGVTVTGSNDRGYGFQAIAQAGNNVAGELSLNSNSSSLEVNGDFIQHSSRTTSGEWIFEWLAPDSDVGEITFSASGLATGGANGNAGDEVYTEDITIPALVPVDFEGLFFSEYAEGSSYNKYLEIYNGTGSDLDLSDYSISSCNNGCDSENEFDYPENITFETGTILLSGDVYVIYHQDADDAIISEGDQTFTYLGNGDDAFAITLAGATADNYTIVDIIGDMGGDPGDGWDVAGISNGTKDHTLVRKSNVLQGNTGNWSSSAGTSEDNSEWVVLDNNTWDYLGSHPHEFGGGEITLVITSPQNGSTINDDGLSIEFSVSNFIIGSDEDGVDGHIHYSLDEGDPVMYYSTEAIVLDNLTEGDHSFHMWLVDTDHAPLDPSIEANLDFTISGEVTITSIYDIQYVSDPDSDDASPYNGQEVTINGIVTAEFWGSDQYRYMTVQDAEGPWNGIVCFDYNGWDQFSWVDEFGNVHAGPGEGDEVTLTGTIEEYYNLTELTDVTTGIVHSGFGPENLINPSVISVSDISEAYEGCLLKIENISVTNPDLGYGEWEFSDGSNTGICDDKWDYFYYPSQDHNLLEIVGVLDYNFNNYKIQPRLARDVVGAGGITRIQRVQQVLYSDLMKTIEDASSDTSYMSQQTVTLEGVVTMPSGLSYAGSGVKFIFADVNGGPWSAILSYDPDSSAFPTLFEGDLIQATGYIAEYTTGSANMTELFITEPINIIDVEYALPVIDTINTGDLRLPTTAEQWGNVMVRVEEGIVTENDFQYEVFALDDGSGSVLVDDDSDSIAAYFESVGPPPVGSLLQSLEGWAYHHYGSYEDSSTYKLCPLYVSDMEFGSGPPSISDLSRDPCAPVSTDSEVVVSCAILDNSTISEALLYYSINGGEYSSVAMSSTEGDIFSGVIPISDGDEVFYYVSATDDGTDQSEPKTSIYPYDIEHEQLGFHVSDVLTISMIQETPWAAGNTLYQGCNVTVSGVVTADTAQFNSSYGAYALQDGTGQWDGLIFSTDQLELITRGDNITITGLATDRAIGDEYGYKLDGNTRLINSTITVNSSGEDLSDYQLVSCEDLHQIADEVESYEGVLVQVNNVTISSIGDYDWSITDASGYEILIDDDMANMEADILMNSLSEGQELDYMRGIFNFSYGTYKIQTRDVDDMGTTMGVNDDVAVNPYDYELHNNFPNPFNPETQIRFSIGSSEIVKLTIYDMMGRQVRSLISGESYGPGFHVVNWEGLNNQGEKVPSGMYIYRIKAGNFIADKKMVLVK